MDMIALYKPYMPESLPELKNILYSGALSYGKWGRLFEEQLANFIGEERITVVNSYNSAMLIALAVIGIKPGDEIIASPMSCLASNQPFITQGAKVVWADIDPNTGTLCPESVRKKVTHKTKAIFHNHHCGYVGYIDEINDIGRENDIIVVDDAIEAFGSEYKGNRIGNVGSDITVFSFQTVRLPNTIDGGALSFNSNELYIKAKLTRDLGVDRSIFRDSSGEISSLCDISLPGFGATLSDVNSYIGLMQMNDLDQLLKVQRANAKKWENVITKKYNNLMCLKPISNTQPNYWVYGTFSENKVKDVKELRDKGFNASGIHLNNNLYSVFSNNEILPGVNEFYSKFVAVPSGWWFSLHNIIDDNS
jgi:perosamine synthetase